MTKTYADWETGEGYSRTSDTGADNTVPASPPPPARYENTDDFTEDLRFGTDTDFTAHEQMRDDMETMAYARAFGIGVLGAAE